MYEWFGSSMYPTYVLINKVNLWLSPSFKINGPCDELLIKYLINALFFFPKNGGLWATVSKTLLTKIVLSFLFLLFVS